MEKHFCMCRTADCPHHPSRHDLGCDPCIRKNLELGEIPACFWENVSRGVSGTTKWSAENFSRFCLEENARRESV
jgi:hypothetical protein